MNAPPVISLLSLMAILSVFYLLNGWREASEDGFLNIVGPTPSYTTHRILIEAMSRITLVKINAGGLSDTLLLAMLLVYPFVRLGICTLPSLGFQKLSVELFGDLFFSSPAAHS